MYSEAFLNELLENCKKEYEYFSSFQDKILDIFDVTHSILTKHNIEYYAAYGTLLGVYRDKGMIPWDHDFDIMISVNESTKVQKILERELPKEYYIVSNFNDPKFPYYQMRVSKCGYDHRLHVDIFYLFGLPDDEDTISEIKNTTIKLVKSRMQRLLKPPKTDSKKREIYYRVMGVMNKVIHPLQYKERIDRKIQELIHMYPYNHSNKVAAFCEAFTVLKKEDLGEPLEINFGNHRILIPMNTDNILNCYYKDYRAYPSLESRLLEYNHGLAQIKDIDHRRKAKIDDYRNE